MLVITTVSLLPGHGHECDSLHVSGRAGLLHHSSAQREDSARGDHRHQLCRGIGRRDSSHEQSIAQTEHLKEMLVGNILTVSWSEVRLTAIIYGIIGLFHYIFRKKFLLISMDEEAAEKQGLSIRFWVFLFYASFGFVVTSSVAIAGVLLVFCYLIVPSVGAMLYARQIGHAWRSAGPWELWYRPSASISHSKSISRRAPRSSAPSESS